MQVLYQLSYTPEGLSMLAGPRGRGPLVWESYERMLAFSSSAIRERALGYLKE